MECSPSRRLDPKFSFVAASFISALTFAGRKTRVVKEETEEEEEEYLLVEEEEVRQRIASHTSGEKETESSAKGKKYTADCEVELE